MHLDDVYIYIYTYIYIHKYIHIYILYIYLNICIIYTPLPDLLPPGYIYIYIYNASSSYISVIYKQSVDVARPYFFTAAKMKKPI
jgi:hypothetical protein